MKTRFLDIRIVEGSLVDNQFYNVHNLVEKPNQDEAPSNLAILGRYILTPRIFEILSSQKPGAGNEIQLTDAIAELNKYEAVYAYAFEGTRYDVGEKLGFIKTTLEFALNREDLRNSVLDYLAELMKKELINKQYD